MTANRSAPRTTGGGPLPSLPLLRAVVAFPDRAASARRLAQAALAQAARKQAPASSGPTRRASLSGFGTVPSYSGKLPSPLPRHPFTSSDRVRGWVDDAARYQKLPTELPATVLQNENSPKASLGRQILQAAERLATTDFNIYDHLYGGAVPNILSEGSTGIGNVKRPTLQRTKAYVEGTLDRPLVPDDVARRTFGARHPTMAGLDTRNDIYYSATHVRQLTDEVTGVRDYVGPLTPEQVHRITARYAGRGPKAEVYGRDAVNSLRSAASGERPLYFYQPRPPRN